MCKLESYFYKNLSIHNVNFFTGVPDSLLKEFCLCVDDFVSQEKHIITANEGNAIALASGYHLATGELPMVYMQNSGLGNAINPLLSLCDPDVYSIPIILLIGWRGEPGVKDEPQHIKQGRVQLDLLKTMSHPNLRTVISERVGDEGLVFTMKFIDGHDIDRQLKQGVSADLFRQIISDVCDGLSALHAQRLVHGDIALVIY